MLSPLKVWPESNHTRSQCSRRQWLRRASSRSLPRSNSASTPKRPRLRPTSRKVTVPNSSPPNWTTERISFPVLSSIWKVVFSLQCSNSCRSAGSIVGSSASNCGGMTAISYALPKRSSAFDASATNGKGSSFPLTIEERCPSTAATPSLQACQSAEEDNQLREERGETPTEESMSAASTFDRTAVMKYVWSDK